MRRNKPEYSEDFVAWTAEQATRLRARDYARLDAEHLAEEIESLGASERRELRRRLSRLLQHLLKWSHQSEHQSRSWSTTIRVQRDAIAELLSDSPSLRAAVPEMLPRAFAPAREWAVEEAGLLSLPANCPWTADEILSSTFLPGP